MAQVKKYHPTLTVYTGSQQLFQLFNGIQTASGRSKIEPTIDPDGNYIIGKGIFDAPQWDTTGIGTLNGVPGIPDGTRIESLLTEIPLCYWEETP